MYMYIYTYMYMYKKYLHPPTVDIEFDHGQSPEWSNITAEKLDALAAICMDQVEEYLSE